MFEKTDEQKLEELLLEFVDKCSRCPQAIQALAYEFEGTEEYLHEGVAQNLKHAKNKTKEGVKRVSRTVNHKIDKGSEHLDNLIKAVKKEIVGASREEIMTNHRKVSTIVKTVLKTGAVFLINPTIGLITLVIKLALKSRLTKREREKILADLKLELEICEEKINDATNAGDKQKKYELMRLRNELKRNILRIQNAGRGIRNIG